MNRNLFHRTNVVEDKSVVEQMFQDLVVDACILTGLSISAVATLYVCTMYLRQRSISLVANITGMTDADCFKNACVQCVYATCI